MPHGLFISHRGHLQSQGGGVQGCTREFQAVIEAAGIELTTVPVDHDRRLSTRLWRRIDSSPYLRPVAPKSLAEVISQIERSRPDFIFLNQVALAAVARRLRKHASVATRIVLLSHGMESTDLIHQIRLRTSLPLSGYARPTATIAMGGILLAEAALRPDVDVVVALSPFDVDLEHWIGTRRVDWLPRTIAAPTLAWRPDAGRLGWVGTLDHAPNLDGLVAVLDVMPNTRRPDTSRIRVVGESSRIGAWLKSRFANVEYLGRLSDDELRREAATWSGFLHPIFRLPRGCSTKLATAIGWRLPIVTTPQGRRGYIWREGSLLEAHDPETFVRHALALRDQAFAVSVRNEVERVAATSPTLPEVAARLRQILGLATALGA